MLVIVKNIYARLLKVLARKLGYLRIFYYYKNNHIAIGTFIGKGVTIGRYTNINHASHLEGPLSIGIGCAIAGRLIIRTSNHNYKYLNMNYIYQRSYLNSNITPKRTDKIGVKIGNMVWIGDSVIILPGVKIGDGAVIGAGSVVTRDVPNYSIVAGSPATVINYRFDEKTREKLCKIKWWCKNKKQLTKIKAIFEKEFEYEDIQYLE